MNYFVFHAVATRCESVDDKIMVENALQAGIMQAESAEQTQAACLAACLLRYPLSQGWKGHKATAMPAVLDNAPTVREYMESVLQ